MWINSFLDLIFPPHCEICRKPGDEPICIDCFRQIKFMKPQFGVYSVSVYEGALRTALHRFKFKKSKKMSRPLGILMVKYLSQINDFDPAKIDWLVPVPLHRRRLKKRGYNQAELLSNVIGHYLELPVVEALKRVRNTHPQFDLPREKRLSNIRSAFEIGKGTDINGKRLLLIDDIYTTGATVNECCRTLLRSGASSVKIFTLARAVELC